MTVVVGILTKAAAGPAWERACFGHELDGWAREWEGEEESRGNWGN
jgi:hypothetical protein